MATHPTASIVGAAPAIEELRRQIRHLAGFDTPRNPHVPTVLLQGETGTGKGLVARAIHASGGRARGPFVDVNCAAIPDTMLEAELFGFEAGAFTDARRMKPGLFEAAAGGTLFLDEVDALPIVLQGKLLKAIEEKSIRRLGAVAAQTVDVKLVAATAKDLRELVATGAFRPDLYHRLAVVILHVPALRERADDVVRLAEHFLASHAKAHGVDAKRLGRGAPAWLAAQRWPGNVRELSHLLERVTLLSLDAEVTAATLEQLRVPLPGVREPGAAPVPSPGENDDVAAIRDALARSGGNVVRAARLLGLGRNALRHRMRRHGIERPSLDEPPPPAVARPAAPAPEPVPHEPSWERKPVAVLAVEVVLPDDAHEPWTVARRWQTMIAEHVGGFGGLFLARSPARATAVFGVPRALEQLPERAVQAALAIQRGVGGGLQVELRIAVHLGTVQVDVRAADPLVGLLAVGDTLALPERLLGHAGPGEILVSPPVARRVEAMCELRPRELRVGEAVSVAAAVVIGRRPRPAAPPDESRFVGRERELDLISESFEAAAAGAGQVVFVVGEAGIGKSRLLAELRRRLGDAPHLWVEGRCASYGTTTAFLPIVDGLRRLFGIDDRDDEASACEKVDRAMTALGGEIAWAVPFVRHVLSLDPGDTAMAALDSATRRSETFRALKSLMLRAAERRPLVLVVEDLHWIDPATEEYLAFIADAVPTTRALLVCSHRPGYSHPFGDRSYHVRVSLRALSAAEMAAISGSLLGDAEVPAEVRALIAAKAEGNPFFVEEVTRSLLEDGTIRRENGRVVLTRGLADIAVPGTIQDVLAARLDRLADDQRQAIQVASVIGREFALRLLERITEAGEGVRTHVDELRALELIYEKATRPELAYMFKHALTHDVAYDSVLRDRRRELHRTIGLAIEELYAERLPEFYETLAHHFHRAEDWERALLYHEHAAEKAADHFANRAVIAHGHHALAIADRLGDAVPDARRQALEQRVGLASFYVSEFVAGGEAFERAAERSAEPASRGVNLFYAGFSHFWGHAYDRSRRAGAAAAEIAARHGVPLVGALATYLQAFELGVCTGDLETDERLMVDALRVCERSGDEAALGLMRFSVAQVAEWRGDYHRSIALSQQAIAAGRKLRLAHLVIWPGWFLGKAWCCLGDYGAAMRQLTEAYETCDRIGDRAWKTRLLNTIGWCLGEVGQPARARDYNLRAAELARDIGDPEIVGNSEINLASNHLALGEVDRALGYLEPIREALARPGDPWMRWRYRLHALDVGGRIALAGRDPERAAAAGEEAAAGARQHHAPKIEARALGLQGEALLALDRRDEARQALAAATAIADRIGYPRALRDALPALVEVERRAGAATEAERHAARLEQILARLPPDLR